jgi:hypothetical protein
MGTPWNERRAEDDESSMERVGTLPARPGLEASELDLLRRAPDYDAEEMASVRPGGGWPASLAPLQAPLTEPGPIGQPAPPSWLPPNRIEPPAMRAAPAEAFPAVVVPRGVAPGTAVELPGTRFPEERTMALMAEDLMGRPLDEQAPTIAAPVHQPGDPPAAWIARPATGSPNLWDAAMPLVVEG